MEKTYNKLENALVTFQPVLTLPELTITLERQEELEKRFEEELALLSRKEAEQIEEKKTVEQFRILTPDKEDQKNIEAVLEEKRMEQQHLFLVLAQAAK